MPTDSRHHCAYRPSKDDYARRLRLTIRRASPSSSVIVARHRPPVPVSSLFIQFLTEAKNLETHLAELIHKDNVSWSVFEWAMPTHVPSSVEDMLPNSPFATDSGLFYKVATPVWEKAVLDKSVRLEKRIFGFSSRCSGLKDATVMQFLRNLKESWGEFVEEHPNFRRNWALGAPFSRTFSKWTELEIVRDEQGGTGPAPEKRYKVHNPKFIEEIASWIHDPSVHLHVRAGIVAGMYERYYDKFRLVACGRLPCMQEAIKNVPGDADLVAELSEHGLAIAPKPK